MCQETTCQISARKTQDLTILYSYLCFCLTLDGCPSHSLQCESCSSSKDSLPNILNAKNSLPMSQYNFLIKKRYLNLSEKKHTMRKTGTNISIRSQKLTDTSVKSPALMRSHLVINISKVSDISNLIAQVLQVSAYKGVLENYYYLHIKYIPFFIIQVEKCKSKLQDSNNNSMS